MLADCLGRSAESSRDDNRATSIQAEGSEEGLPASKRIAFAPSTDKQRWQSTYVIPGVLGLDYQQGSDVVIQARVRIHSQQRSIALTVSLRLRPASEKDVRFATIADEFRKCEEPSEF